MNQRARPKPAPEETVTPTLLRGELKCPQKSILLCSKTQAANIPWSRATTIIAWKIFKQQVQQNIHLINFFFLKKGGPVEHLALRKFLLCEASKTNQRQNKQNVTEIKDWLPGIIIISQKMIKSQWSLTRIMGLL